MRKKAIILLNDTAGIGRAGSNTWAIVKRFAKEGYEPVVFPIIPGTELVCEKILSEYDGQADIVLCSGGDGTLNHVVQAIMQMKNKLRIAYLPAGSTNDFAKMLGIPAEFEKSLEIAINGKTTIYDIGCLNGKYFNYIAAFGAFSAISYATDQQLKNLFGHAAYIVSAVSELYENIHYSRHMRIESDDFTIEDDFIFGAVCNSAYVAGFTVFREIDVSLDDEKMEILLIKTPKTASDLQGILNAIQRGTLDHPFLTFRHISNVKITSDNETAWTVDGEFGGSYKEANINVIRHAISIMTKNK